MTYTSECILCAEKGVKTHYIGETSNSLAERTLQHVDDCIDNSKESHMRRHCLEEHAGANPTKVYKVSQITPHTSAFSRQLEEAFLIKQFRGGTLLNTKYEYNHGFLPSNDSKAKFKPEYQQLSEPEAKKMARLQNEEIEMQACIELKRKILNGTLKDNLQNLRMNVQPFAG